MGRFFEPSLFVGRSLVVGDCLLFLLNLSDPQESFSYYGQALFVYLVVCVVRLFQRCGMPKISQAYMQSLLEEDACHYILYCSIFMSARPTMLALIPIFVYSLFASAAYLKTLLGAFPRVEALINRMQQFFPKARELASQAEIALLFLLLFNAITNLSLHGLLLVFMYAQYSMLRTASKRNPSPAQAWGNFKTKIDTFAGHPKCPALVATTYHKISQKVAGFVAQVRAAQTEQASRRQQQPAPADSPKQD